MFRFGSDIEKLLQSFKMSVFMCYFQCISPPRRKLSSRLLLLPNMITGVKICGTQLSRYLCMWSNNDHNWNNRVGAFIMATMFMSLVLRTWQSNTNIRGYIWYSWFMEEKLNTAENEWMNYRSKFFFTLKLIFLN